jgi:hypothetical protein
MSASTPFAKSMCSTMPSPRHRPACIGDPGQQIAFEAFLIVATCRLAMCMGASSFAFQGRGRPRRRLGTIRQPHAKRVVATQEGRPLLPLRLAAEDIKVGGRTAYDCARCQNC